MGLLVENFDNFFLPSCVFRNKNVLSCPISYLSQDPSKASFSNSLGDLKKNIEYLIGMERQSGSMDVISPLYVSRMLNVPLEDVEKCMKEMGL